MNRIAAVALSALVAAGCAVQSQAPTDGSDTTSTTGALSFDQKSATLVSGQFKVDGQKALFQARQVADQVFDVQIEENGLTLTADMNYKNKQFMFDGYASKDGSDTVLTQKDHFVIDELGKALADLGMQKTKRDPKHRGVVFQSPGSAMVRALSVWKLTPEDASLRKDIKAQTGRTIQYLCGYLTGYGLAATHDCWDCWDNWDGWNYVNIGPNGYSYNCYPDSCSSSCSNYGNNHCGKQSCEYSSGGGPKGTWEWGSNADKYAACTVWDTNAYTHDCLMHDHCVRNDHGLLSSWCSDEASHAVDDQTDAHDCIMHNGCSGHCGGYNAAEGCYCDSACDSYGDCCMDKHQQCG